MRLTVNLHFTFYVSRLAKPASELLGINDGVKYLMEERSMPKSVMWQTLALRLMMLCTV
jgi:hypothetical protein